MKKTNSVLSFLWRTTGGQKKRIAALAVMRIMVSISLVLVSFCMKELIDSAVSHDTSAFRLYAGSLLLTYLVQQGAKAGAIVFSESCKANLENGYKKILFTDLMYKSFSEVSEEYSEKWISLLTSDTSIVANNLVSVFSEGISIIVRLICITVFLVHLVPELVILLVPAGVVMALISFALRQKMKDQHKAIQSADQDLRVGLAEGLRNQLVIRSFSKEEDLIRDIESRSGIHLGKRMEKARYTARMSILFGLVMRGLSFVGAVFGGVRLIQGTLSYGSFYAVMQLINLVRVPASEISGLVPDIYAMIASAERLMSVQFLSDVQRIPVMTREEVQNYYNDTFSSILWDNVTFSYGSGSESEPETKNVLNEVSFSIRKGETVGIVSPSGFGKTTILKLLLCLYTPGQGKILLKDADGTVNEIDPSYRSLFAYVPQGNELLFGSIREDVSFWDEKADDDKVWAALDLAGLKKAVEELPNGLDSVVGERGDNLSGGQKQRLALARAFYAGSPILLLDEVTSALDEGTERQILLNLKGMTDKTVVLITHRASVLNECERVIRINEDGTIAEEGNDE